MPEDNEIRLPYFALCLSDRAFHLNVANSCGALKCAPRALTTWNHVKQKLSPALDSLGSWHEYKICRFLLMRKSKTS